jgi:anti-anti-sigma regulatory factor
MHSTALADSDVTARVIRLNGALGSPAQRALREMLAGVHGRCELDLSQLHTIDSATMTQLVALARRLGPRAVTLRGASRQFLRILDMIGLSHLFEIER